LFNFTHKAPPGKITISNAQRINLLSYIKAIDKSGKDVNQAIKNKLDEFVILKKKRLANQMRSIMEFTGKGGRLIEGLYECNIINKQELYILVNSKTGLADGIEKIINNSKNSGKMMLGVSMFLLPILAIAGALLLFHGQVKDIVIGVTAPMREAGATPPPIKDYLIDPTTYIIVNIGLWLIIGAVFGLMLYLKKYQPKEYLKSIPILEQEFTIDVLNSLKTMMDGGGMNLSDAAKALEIGSTDNIKKLVYGNIVSRTRRGQQRLSDALWELGVSYNTVSALKIGEDGNDIVVGINIALDDLEARYKRNVGIYLRVAFWGGQFGMMGIAIKPMVDILMLMSVGQMNFEL